MIKQFHLYFFLLLPLIFFSCSKELGKPSWDTEIVAPIFKTSLSINNIIPDSLLTYNSDNTINLVYNYDLFDLKLDTMVHLSENLSRDGWAFPISIRVPPGIVLDSINSISPLDITPAQLSEIIIDKGNLFYDIRNRIKDKLIYSYSVPGATLNNIPFTSSIKVPAANSSSEAIDTGSFDMSGYTLKLQTGKYLYNTISSFTKIQIDPKADTILIKPQDSIVYTLKFKNIKIYYAKGFLGSENYSIKQDTTSIDFFNKIKSGTIGFEKVKVNIEIINNIGMDAYIIMNQLTAINSRTNQVSSLAGSAIGSAMTIARARETGNPANPVSPTSYFMNFDNTNIKNLLENLPDKIACSFNLNTNPLGNISGGNDFFYSDYGVKIKLNMEIPLSLQSNNLVLKDTIAADINIDSQLRNGTFNLIIDNGFPFNATVQLYLLNNNHQLIDSLPFTNNLVASAPIDINNKVTNPSHTILPIPVSENRLFNLRQTKYIIACVKINTAGLGQYVKIYKDYKFNIKLSGDINYQQSF